MSKKNKYILKLQILRAADYNESNVLSRAEISKQNWFKKKKGSNFVPLVELTFLTAIWITVSEVTWL